MIDLLVTGAEIGARTPVDVRIRGGVIAQIGRDLAPEPGEQLMDAAGGALIPGLHDHHLHLRALLARRTSVSLRDKPLSGLAEFAAGDGWLRVVDAVGPEFEAARARDLDRVISNRPVRIAHHSGSLWLLNKVALELLRVADWAEPGVERDDNGRPTGRLFRLDHKLRATTGVPDEQWRELSDEALRLGITGFTDATPRRAPGDVEQFNDLARRGVIAQDVLLMAEDGDFVAKIVLDDPTLPAGPELAAMIGRNHDLGRNVAIHCVTADQLVTALAAWSECGAAPGDRIEHAGVVPPGFAARIAEAGIAVVTQPGFIHDHGDRYRRDVAPDEQPWLYPCASLLHAGVSVAFSSDAPYGPLDPWVAIATATTRRTGTGAALGGAEHVNAPTALRRYLLSPRDLGVERVIRVGEPARLCLLREPLHAALAAPGAGRVRAGITPHRVAVA